VDVAREAGDDDPVLRVLDEDLAERLADRPFAAAETGLLGVRRVREQETNPDRVGERADAGEVGQPAVDRREVELEVPRVEHDSLGGVEGDREALRHRVRHGDELDVERADPPSFAVGDRDQFGTLRRAGVLES